MPLILNRLIGNNCELCKHCYWNVNIDKNCSNCKRSDYFNLYLHRSVIPALETMVATLSIGKYSESERCTVNAERAMLALINLF